MTCQQCIENYSVSVLQSDLYILCSLCILQCFEEAIARQNGMKDDHHVAAFASYELGIMLAQKPEVSRLYTVPMHPVILEKFWNFIWKITVLVMYLHLMKNSQVIVHIEVGHAEHSGNLGAWSREGNVNSNWPFLHTFVNEPKYSQFKKSVIFL